MFDRTKQCNMSHKMIRLNNFLYVLNLRQGTILIAVHQIALSAFILIILLVGVCHVGQMLTMLHNDMEDDADRRGYEMVYEDHTYRIQYDAISTNNQRRFAKAQHLALAMVIFLYGSTILICAYLMCCVLLLHGAIQYKRKYVLPWIVAACIGVVLIIIAIVVGHGYPCVVNMFGGHNFYHVASALFVSTLIYALCTVSSFALDMGSGRCARATRAASDERGERLLLLDHAAHSSLLSAAQLNKLNSGTRTHFV